MSDTSDEYLAKFLREQGHSDEEIERLLERLQEHDAEMFRQSVFDSIEAGSFDLDAILKRNDD